MSQKKIRVIHIEDEPKARLVLESIIENYVDNAIFKGSAESIELGKKLIKKTDFDLLFLDLNLMDGNGFEILKTFPEIAKKTVLCTADETKGIDAVKLGVLDYVVKPYDIEEMNEVMIRYTNLSEKTVVPVLNEKRLVVHDVNGSELIELDDIVRLESDRNYTKIWLLNGDQKYVSKTLKIFDNLLSLKGFIRVHKSHLINSKYVKRLNKSDGGTIEMTNGEVVKISVSGREILKNSLGL